MKEFLYKQYLRARLIGLILIKPDNRRLVLKAAVYVLIALVLTGHKTGFGFIDELIGDQFAGVWTNLFSLDGWQEALFSIITGLSTVSIAATILYHKLNRLTSNDIKSRKFKIALIKNNIKLSTNTTSGSELSTKPNTSTNEVSLNDENLIAGTIRVAGEVSAVMQADLTSKADFEEVKEDMGLGKEEDMGIIMRFFIFLQKIGVSVIDFVKDKLNLDLDKYTEDDEELEKEFEEIKQEEITKEIEREELKVQKEEEKHKEKVQVVIPDDDEIEDVIVAINTEIPTAPVAAPVVTEVTTKSTTPTTNSEVTSAQSMKDMLRSKMKGR